MLRTTLTLFIILSMSLMSMAHYSIHSASEGVRIESSGRNVAAKPGNEVKATDILIIPEGCEIEIYNSLDKNIYKSTSSGKYSVTKLMLDARKIASNNQKNVMARLRVAKGGNAEAEGEKIYVEKGVVRRSLAVFDPEADNLQVDSKALAKRIAGFLQHPDNKLEDVDVRVSNGTNDSTGVYFRVENTLDFPIYFNVLKINARPDIEQRRVEVSSLGQPDGSYVLLPGQAITRESNKILPEGENHLLVLTHFRYDLDEVVDETDQCLRATQTSNEETTEFPFLIRKL